MDSHPSGQWRVRHHDHDNKDFDNEHPQNIIRTEELRIVYHVMSPTQASLQLPKGEG